MNNMRHFIIRLICGVIWIVVAAIMAVRENLFYAAVYAVLGVAFLASAWSQWKKNNQ